MCLSFYGKGEGRMRGFRELGLTNVRQYSEKRRAPFALPSPIEKWERAQKNGVFAMLLLASVAYDASLPTAMPWRRRERHD